MVILMLIKYDACCPIKRGDVCEIDVKGKYEIFKRKAVVLMHDDMIPRRDKILISMITNNHEEELDGEAAIGKVQYIKDGKIHTIHMDETCFKCKNSLSKRLYSLSESVMENCNAELFRLLEPGNALEFEELDVVEKEFDFNNISNLKIPTTMSLALQEAAEKERAKAVKKEPVENKPLIKPKSRENYKPKEEKKVDDIDPVVIVEQAVEPHVEEIDSGETEDLEEAFNMYLGKDLTARQAAELLGITVNKFYYHFRKWKTSKDIEVNISEESPETIDVEPDLGATFKEMEYKLRNVDVLIVGGNINWQKKLKKKFPKWTFLTGDINPTKAVNVNHALIYIFDKSISHSAFDKYQDACKSAGKEFGYIKKVNVESNMRQIYADAVATGHIR